MGIKRNNFILNVNVQTKQNKTEQNKVNVNDCYSFTSGVPWVLIGNDDLRCDCKQTQIVPFQ